MVGAGSLAFAAAAPNDVPLAVTVPRQPATQRAVLEWIDAATEDNSNA
jgi:hypothetical protein